MKPFQILLALLLVVLVIPARAQGGKAFFKEAETLRSANQLEQALEKYTLAVQVDPKYLKAFQARADVYELLGRKEDAAGDRRKVAELDPGEPEHGALASKATLEAGDAQGALVLAERALAVDRKCMNALQAKVRAALALNDVDKAVAAADDALALKATTDTYYLHGLARMAQRDFRTAEFDLDKVIEWNHLYEPAYVAQAETQLQLYAMYSGATMQMRTLEKAIDKCTRALELNTMSADALFVRSKAYGLQKEFAKAIDDVSHVISLGRDTPEVRYQRALYYQGFGQYQNAINDLNKALKQAPEDLKALELRVDCKEANVDPEGARRDLEQLIKALDADTGGDPLRKRALQERKVHLDGQIFEMNRESDPPVITVVEPKRKSGDVVQVGAGLAQVKVTGHVRDRNFLKSIIVNRETASFATDEKDPEFFASIPLVPGSGTINVQAVDIYDNVTELVFTVERTESVPPLVVLTQPAAIADRTIAVASDAADIFLEGTVADASGIRSITVDGVFASFVPDTNATEFSIKVPLKDKERITVRAEDQNGNATDLVYGLKRTVPVIAVVEKPRQERSGTEKVEKPSSERPVSSATGITWVVLIENTDYKGFPPVQGAASDLADVQRSFGKYSVQRTINKRNLTKSQLERFFNIELRDLVRSNKVNTILVGYVGHGRSASGKSYWVPVDGRKDDVYGFYNYGSLKNLLENYSQSVTNTLVVSRSAGTDPSFYELTR